MHHTPVVEVKDLHKSFGDIKAVDGLSFNVSQGDIYGLLGVNGSGKSTTIRLLLTLLAPDSGKITILGYPLNGKNRKIKRRIGALIEGPDFYNYLTACKNLEILLKYSTNRSNRNRIEEVLEIVGLKKFMHKKVGIFSHGMKQRLGIAQAMIHDPELIIFDEPASGLDPHGIVDIRNLIRTLNTEFKKTIILSSHILKEIEMIANRMLIIHEGKALAEGEVDKLLESYTTRVRMVVSKIETARKVLKKSEYAKSVEFQGNEILCYANETDASAINRMLVEHNIDVYAIIPVKNLEDYFISLT